MKYLGSVTDPKDVATKEYVDKAVSPHKKVYPHTQSFVASAGSNTWTYMIPWDGDPPTIDELLNFNAYHYNESNGGISAVPMDKYTASYTANTITYIVAFASYTSSGNSTIVFQNSFTDSDGTIASGM